MQNLGNEKECQSCGTKYFDFNQPDVVSCPVCPVETVVGDPIEPQVTAQAIDDQGATQDGHRIDYGSYLQTWRTLESVVMQLSEEECLNLLRLEKEGRARPSFIQRLFGRATVLKRRNERGELGLTLAPRIRLGAEERKTSGNTQPRVRTVEIPGGIVNPAGADAAEIQASASPEASLFLEGFLARILGDPGIVDQQELRRTLTVTPRSVLLSIATLDHYARLLHPRIVGKPDGPLAFLYGVQNDIRMRPRVMRIALLPIPPYDKINIKTDPRISDRKDWFRHVQDSSREWKSCSLAIPTGGLGLADVRYILQQFIEAVESTIGSPSRLKLGELGFFPGATPSELTTEDTEVMGIDFSSKSGRGNLMVSPSVPMSTQSASDIEERERLKAFESPTEDIVRPQDLDEEADGDNAEMIMEDSSTVRWRDDSHTIHEFCRRYGRGRIELRPEFQRDYVWTLKIARRFIESIFLGLPIPTIYMAETEDNQLLVIDGQQRLQTIVDFHENRFPLSSVSVASLSALEGLRFRDLPGPLQDRFEDYRLSVIVLEKSCSPQLKFDMFERLNQGSVKLNKQELRNCLYRGPYNQLLSKIADMEAFLYACGWKQQRRMRGEELVLRFFTFHFRNVDSIKTYESALNEEMRINQSMTLDGLARRERLFRDTLSTCVHVFGANPFRMWNMGKSIKDPTGHWEDRLNSVVFEVLMTSMASYDKPRIVANADAIQEEFIHLLSTDQFMVDSLTLGTNSREKMRYRHDTWRAALRSLLESTEKEKRYFQQGFKRELWQRDQICGICKQVIHSIEDAAVDHVLHYWRGGQTIPSNGRLTHQYCNSRRSGRDD